MFGKKIRLKISDNTAGIPRANFDDTRPVRRRHVIDIVPSVIITRVIRLENVRIFRGKSICFDAVFISYIRDDDIDAVSHDTADVIAADDFTGIVQCRRAVGIHNGSIFINNIFVSGPLIHFTGARFIQIIGNNPADDGFPFRIADKSADCRRIIMFGIGRKCLRFIIDSLNFAQIVRRTVFVFLLFADAELPADHVPDDTADIFMPFHMIHINGIEDKAVHAFRRLRLIIDGFSDESADIFISDDTVSRFYIPHFCIDGFPDEGADIIMPLDIGGFVSGN